MNGRERNLALLARQMRETCARGDWAAADERIPEFMKAWYGPETPLDDAAKERGLQELLGEARKLRRPSLNGAAEKTLPLPLVRSRLPWSLGAAAVAACLILIAVLVLQFAGPARPARETMVEKSTPEKPGPTKQEKPNIVDREKQQDPGLAPRTAPRHERLADRTKPEPTMAKVLAGKLAAVVGEPRISFNGRTSAARAAPGVALYAGTVIETGDADRCQVRLNDGTTLSLDFNTKVVLLPPLPKEDRQDVDLEAGHLWAVVAPQPEGASFSVETPAATALALGTEFGLRVKPRTKTAPARTTLSVKEGRVKFYNDRGAVEAGPMTESFARDGGRPSEPRRVEVLGSFKLQAHLSNYAATGILSPLQAALKVDAPIGAYGFAVTLTADHNWQVSIVEPNSLADRAGLKPGDFWPATDADLKGTPIGTLLTYIREDASTFRMSVLRGGHRMDFHLKPPVRRIAGLDARNMPTYRKLVCDALLEEPGALASLERFAKEHPIAPVLHDLGVVYERNESIGRAIDQYQLAVISQPRSARYHRSLAAALKKIGNLERALEEYSIAHALEAPPDDEIDEVREILALLGRSEESFAYVRKAAESKPGSLQVWIALSKALLERQEPGWAERAARHAVDLGPNHSDAWVALSWVQTVRGDTRNALNSIDRALALNPSSSGALGTKGLILFEAGDRLGAQQVLRRAYSLDHSLVNLFNLLSTLISNDPEAAVPEDAESLLRTAMARDLDHKFTRSIVALLTKLGHLQEAKRLAVINVNEHPSDGCALVNLAIIYGKLGDKVKEEELLQGAMKIQPDCEHAPQNLANIFMERGEVEKAAVLYRKSYELKPNAVVLTWLVDALDKLGKGDESRKLMLDFVRTDSRDMGVRAWVFGNLAQRAQQSGQPGEAEEFIRKAIEANPQLSWGQFYLGQIRYAQGRLDEAIVAFRKAIELNPKHVAAYTSLGVALGRIGRNDEGIEAYRAGLRIKPTAIAFANLGIALNGLGRSDEAKAALSEALKLDPRQISAISMLGYIEENAGRQEAAEQWHRKGLAIAPEDPSLLNSLAWNLAARGIQLDEALELAKRASAAAPKDGGILDTLGWVLLKRKEYEPAVETLKRAVELLAETKQSLAEVWLHLGMAHEGVGDKPSAIAAYESALKLDPKYEPAAARLKVLKGER